MGLLCCSFLFLVVHRWVNSVGIQWGKTIIHHTFGEWFILPNCYACLPEGFSEVSRKSSLTFLGQNEVESLNNAIFTGNMMVQQWILGVPDYQTQGIPLQSSGSLVAPFRTPEAASEWWLWGKSFANRWNEVVGSPPSLCFWSFNHGIRPRIQYNFFER